MPLGGIRDYFSRRITHDVLVYGTRDFSLAAPEVRSSHRVVPTLLFSERLDIPTPRIRSLEGGRRCAVKGFVFGDVKIRARGERVRRYGAKGLKVSRVPVRLNLKGLKPKNGLTGMLGLPQERANRLRWQTRRPKAPGEAILAWYGPIVEKAVIKLALNKGRGTLLVWYNPQCPQFGTGSVYVYRRLGAGEKAEMRWDREPEL